ncbi:hypothetical protein ACTSKR_04830 [Chitinibacteraceae bacterium HSL-7]
MTVLVVNWVLYLAMFVIAGHFLRTAYLTLKLRRADLVRDWRGRRVEGAEAIRTRFGLLSLGSGLALLANGIAVWVLALPVPVWSGVAGIILWLHFGGRHILSWRASLA